MEVEDILFGIDGEDPDYVLSRDGDYFTIYGQTGKGRLLKLVGELREDGRLRVFSAIDMDAKEKRLFQKGRRM
ncbi:MAG: hypothetical protein GIW95_01025 [Candidatus Eremiobacteraeota bacterium]|nr:hypothetical protein [Candidatus Eremiobacteraeota bacterium]